jgi:SAM-dependent methyltransferase
MMSAGVIPRWCCPRCRGSLSEADARLRCDTCWSAYPIVAGIPDFRLPVPAWIDFERDTFEAQALADRSDSASLEELVHGVFAARPGWTEDRIRWRTRQVLQGPERAQRDVAGWLRDPIARGGALLEIGCGPGGFLAALPRDVPAIGTDVCLVWLVVARRLLAERGRAASLAASVAEALPLPDASVATTVAFDVIEHVGDLPCVLKEIDRVSVPDAFVGCTTPNRFSLAGEPHVGIWGVGWLPRRYQRPYVEWRTGEPYTFVRLLSPREVTRAFSRHTRFGVDAAVPPVPAEEIERFSTPRAFAARLYNRLHRLAWLAPLLLAIGPFFHIAGTKRQASARSQE